MHRRTWRGKQAFRGNRARRVLRLERGAQKHRVERLVHLAVQLPELSPVWHGTDLCPQAQQRG